MSTLEITVGISPGSTFDTQSFAVSMFQLLRQKFPEVTGFSIAPAPQSQAGRRSIGTRFEVALNSPLNDVDNRSLMLAIRQALQAEFGKVPSVTSRLLD